MAKVDRVAIALNLPKMLDKGLYYLKAVAADGSGLYEERNFRMGGRSYRVRLADGTERDWTYIGNLGRVSAKPAPVGEWLWLSEKHEDEMHARIREARSCA